MVDSMKDEWFQTSSAELIRLSAISIIKPVGRGYWDVYVRGASDPLTVREQDYIRLTTLFLMGKNED